MTEDPNFVRGESFRATLKRVVRAGALGAHENPEGLVAIVREEGGDIDAWLPIPAKHDFKIGEALVVTPEKHMHPNGKGGSHTIFKLENIESSSQ